MLEAGIVPLKDIIIKKQKSFLVSKRENIDEELPFNFVFDLCRDNGTPGYRFLVNILEQNDERNSLEIYANEVRERAENATKFNTYVSEFNPSLTVHIVYSATQYVPDFCRVAFTRLRLMSHNLKVETGRWSRIPPYARTCQSDNSSIQSESHVLISCPLSADCRTRYNSLNFASVTDLMKVEPNVIIDLCMYIHEVQGIYQ